LKRGKPKAITITNAYNHISDLSGFMKNIDKILAPSGAFVVEAPYLLHLVEKSAFDTIYLEHISYFALKPLVNFFKQFDLRIIDVYENDYMGGSARIYVGRGSQSKKVDEMIKKETEAGLFLVKTYERLMKDVEFFKTNLLKDLKLAKQNGAKIIGIGAATKGNTLMNYCGIDNSLLEFVTDSSPYKIGKYTPGSRIPIRSDEEINESITHALILPWNIATYLKDKLSSKHPTLKFIVPHMG